MTSDFIFTPLVFFGGLALVMVLRRRYPKQEASLLMFGMFAHMGGVFAQIWITREVYGSGDIFSYWESGIQVADALRYDFFHFAPKLVEVFFHKPSTFPFETFGYGATGSQTMVVSTLLFLLGDSLYATCMAVALGAYFGKVALFHSMRDSFPVEFHARVLGACILVPSVVYWSSTISKEAVAIAFLGVAALGARSAVASGRWVRGALIASVPLIPVAMIKTYVLLPFSIAVSVWFYWERSRRRGREVVIKPIYLAFAIVVALVGITAVGRVFPEYSVEHLGEKSAGQRRAAGQIEAGSNFELGVGVDERSIGGQLLYSPLALGTALFRPFLFEVRNAPMLLAALETTAFLVLLLRAISRRGFRFFWKLVFTNPVLMFCLTFALTFATAVGLSTTNMGTLSRYRMPFLPMFAALVLIIDAVSGRRLEPSAPAVRVKASAKETAA